MRSHSLGPLYLFLWYSSRVFIYLFGVLHCFQHCTGHITIGSWEGGGNQYIQFVRVLYCKLLTNGKQLPAFPLEVGPGTEPRGQRWVRFRFVTFNSQGHIATDSLQVEETSAYSTVNHLASTSNYQLSNMKRLAWDSNRRPQRLETRVLPLCHCGPFFLSNLL